MRIFRDRTLEIEVVKLREIVISLMKNGKRPEFAGELHDSITTIPQALYILFERETPCTFLGVFDFEDAHHGDEFEIVVLCAERPEGALKLYASHKITGPTKEAILMLPERFAAKVKVTLKQTGGQRREIKHSWYWR